MEPDVREAVQLMVERALAFRDKQDAFTAYMYLWTAFNNIYRFASPSGGDEAAWTHLLEDGALVKIDDLKTDKVMGALGRLRTNRPQESPDRCGVVDMLSYWRGGDVRLLTLGEAPSLVEIGKVLYAVRNNLVHAIKREVDSNDGEILEAAFTILLPLVEHLRARGKWLPEG